MVTKRIFKLFDKEIDLLTHPEELDSNSDFPLDNKEKRNDEIEDTIDD